MYALALVGLVPAPVAFPLQSPPQRSIKLTASEMLRLAERAEQVGDEATASAIYRALEAGPDADMRAEARFAHARQLGRLGQMRDAAVMLRRLLDEKPNATGVRLHLASMLQRLGDEEAALRELRALRSGDLPITVARFVDRLAATLQASKRFGFHVEAAIAPDTNINHATRSDTLDTLLGDFTLTRDSQARSGVGVALRTLTHARLPLNDRIQLVTRLSADANLYRDKDASDIAAEWSAGPELRIGTTRLGLEAGVGRHYYAMAPYQRSLRLSGSVARPLGRIAHLRIEGGVRRTNNLLNSLQDGTGRSLRLRVERALSPQMLVAFNLGGERFAARDAAFSTRAWSAGLSAYRDVGRVGVTASMQVGRLAADERLGLLPRARADRSMRGSLGIVMRQFTVAGFAPTARLVIERNRSTVIFYDFRRTRAEFGVSRAF